MTINVKLRSALALAVVALAVTSLDLRSANAEHAVPVRAVKAASVVEHVRKIRTNTILARTPLLERKFERKVLALAEQKGLIGREEILRNREDILRNFKREDVLRNF